MNVKKTVRMACALALLAGACGKGSGTTRPVNKDDPWDWDDAKGAGKVEAAPGAGGKIAGKVTYEGTPPGDKLEISANQNICGTSKPDPAVAVVGGGVPNAVVYLNGAKGDVAAAPVTIDQNGCVYSPVVAVANVGAALTVTNSDPILHNIHGYQQNATTFNEATQSAGTSIKSTLEEKGVVEMKCDVHPWMQAFVLVFDHPYYALADATGSFSMTAPPPGDYELVVWHARFGEKRTQVKIDAAGLNVTAVYP